MTDTNEFNQAMEELFSLGRFGIKLGLETISAMLEGIGNPHLRLKCIHIAGTNGKGSVAQTTASVCCGLPGIRWECIPRPIWCI